MVSCRGGHKCLLVLTERVTRQEIMRLIPDKTAGSVVRALNTIERKYGKLFPAVFKSITVDNGSEFADCAGLEQSVLKKRAKRTKMYYCHPYCSSERGSNEKQNQMIRRKFPKGTNFDKVSPKEVKMVEDWLNRYPRKILGWYSSADMFRALIEAVENFFTFCYAYLLTFAISPRFCHRKAYGVEYAHYLTSPTKGRKNCILSGEAWRQRYLSSLSPDALTVVKADTAVDHLVGL